MKRMLTNGEWSLWKDNKNLQLTGMCKIMLRSEQPIHVYGSEQKNFKTEILLGYADNGEIEVMWDRKNAFVRVQSEGRVWFKTFEAAHPVERTSETVYTSLERPSNLSPEMQAIMRMVRKNEIEREQQREQNARIQEDLRRVTAANIANKSRAQSKPATKAAEKVQSEDAERSTTDVAKPDSGEVLSSETELDDAAK